MPFDELGRFRLVLPGDGKPLRQLIERAARARGVRLDVAMEIDGLGPRLRAVAGGLGASVVAPFNVALEEAAGLLTVRPIVEPPITRQIVLECRPGFDRATTATLYRLLIQVLRDLLGPHGRPPPCA